MSTCISNETEVFKYSIRPLLANYAGLSKKSTSKVINTLRINPVKADKINRKFVDLAKREDIVIFPKCSWDVYDSTSTTEPISTLDLRKPDVLAGWIVTEGVQEHDCIKIKHINRIKGNWLENLKYSLHFEKSEWIEYTADWPRNVTVGAVKEISLAFTPTGLIPISDKKSVEKVCLTCSEAYDLAFLQQFTRLKTLEINGLPDKTSLIKPTLSDLEELIINNNNAIINTVNLRVLEILNVTIDDELAALVRNQLRLIKLHVHRIYNFFLISLPSSIKTLIWNPAVTEERQLYEEHLEMQCTQLQLRSFETNVILKRID